MSSTFRVRAGAVIIKNDAILLIEYQDENGTHYNLPGGGVEPGESTHETIKRELKEEACVDVNVGELIFVYEYLPHKSSFRYGHRASLQMFFECKLCSDQIPTLPVHPDRYQTAVLWVSLNQLDQIDLNPKIGNQIIHYSKTRKSIPFLKEESLYD